MRTAFSFLLPALVLLGLSACKGEAPPPSPPPTPRPAILIFVPKLERSLVVDTAGTPDAERNTLVIAVSADSVARYYRNSLPRLGWSIRSDRASGPLIDLYLQGGPLNGSLWVHIESQDTASARYTLIAKAPAGAARPATPRP